MDTDRILSFIIGLLSGSIVGAAIVVLSAPQSGRDMRQGIVDKYNQVLDAGKQAMTEQRQALETEYKARIQIPLYPPQSERSQAA